MSSKIVENKKAGLYIMRNDTAFIMTVQIENFNLDPLQSTRSMRYFSWSKHMRTTAEATAELQSTTC